MQELLQQLANGVVLGALYGLIALGYTMVYGIIQLINFAHGEIFMVGAFGSLFTWDFILGKPTSPWSIPLILIGGVVAAVGVAVLMERFAYRPLRNAPRLAPLITAIGVSVFLQESVRLFYPGGRQAQLIFPQLISGPPVHIGSVEIDRPSIFILVVAIICMVGLDAFVQRSRTGRAMRATAQDPDTARLMGINTDRIIVTAFVLGAALAAVAGMSWGLKYGFVVFDIGFLAGLKAFTAAVLGGIGNLRGAVLGGFILGIVEAMATQFFGQSWKDVSAFVILILVLILRPQGLLGERVADRA
ncbi:MAG: branched-chain amino acid ABC transporter permease [Actinomycetes bacterium]